jgi:Cu-Zn family superoxide dismutase
MLKQTMPLLFETLSQYPVVCARVRGSQLNPNLIGDVWVYPFLEGSVLVADSQGIPFSGFYGFHIHQRGPCIPGEGYTGFEGIGGHFSPTEQPHPYHAGDLPVLMAYYGHAFMIVYSDRFVPREITGRAIVVHQWPDDYRSQPTGDSGSQIACGTFFPCFEHNPTRPIGSVNSSLPT